MVYAVVGGEYSDWYLVGYCKTKEGAEDYCKTHNGQIKWKELYVMELADLDKEPPEGELLCYGVDAGDWSYWQSYSWGKDDIPKDGIYIGEDMFNDPIMYIWIYPTELKRIKKIAQDRYYKWKAEKEGII